MKTLKIKTDKTLENTETGEVETCWRKEGKPPCNTGCSLYNELKQNRWVKCFCLNLVIGMIETRLCKCGCGKTVKGHPNKKFFSQRHKDKFHNRTNPRGFHAIGEIGNITVESIEETMHPQDPYCLGQE